MDVPKNVYTQSIHAKCLAHLYTMLPVFSWYARIMNLGSLNDKWFAIKKKTLLPTSKEPTSWAYTGNEIAHDAKTRTETISFS